MIHMDDRLSKHLFKKTFVSENRGNLGIGRMDFNFVSASYITYTVYYLFLFRICDGVQFGAGIRFL